MAQKSLVFISCGQYTQHEIDLGKAVEQLIRDRTPYDPYFAEQQNTLEGLCANILSSLSRCVGFVGIMHHRGQVDTPDGRITRASVWVEQELAIAAFIQHVLHRKIEVALYIQRGIQREGMRQQVRLRPIEFVTPDEVLIDLGTRIQGWNLEAANSHPVVAEWRFETLNTTQDRHDYRFRVDLLNNGPTKVTEWRAELQFPTAFLENVDRSNEYLRIVKHDSDWSENQKRLYPGDRIEVFNLPYYVDMSNWKGGLYRGEGRRSDPTVLIRVWSGETEPWVTEIPISQLERF